MGFLFRRCYYVSLSFFLSFFLLLEALLELICLWEGGPELAIYCSQCPEGMVSILPPKADTVLVVSGAMSEVHKVYVCVEDVSCHVLLPAHHLQIDGFFCRLWEEG